MDTTTLLRSCIQSAVGMLRDQNKSCQRNMKRVEILLGLLTEEDEFKGRWPSLSQLRFSGRAAGTSLPWRRPSWGGVPGLGTAPLLLCSRVLTGVQDAPLRPLNEARRDLHLQHEGVGGEGSLEPGRSPGGRHLQVLGRGPREGRVKGRPPDASLGPLGNLSGCLVFFPN